MEAGKGKLGSIPESLQHYSAPICIADADDPMSLFTSILKDIAEETIPKISAVPKC